MSNAEQKQAEEIAFESRSQIEFLSRRPLTKADAPTALRRYGLAIGLFAGTLGISIILSYLELKINLTILVVVALFAAAWYGGRGPGLLMASLMVVATLFLNPIPPNTSFAQYAFSNFSVFSLLVFIVLLISGRKEVEKRLRESEKRYRRLFENNPLPVWVYDLETLEILAVNEAAVFYYGYSEKEFLSMTIKNILFDDENRALPEVKTTTDRRLNSAEIWKLRKKDGSVIDAEITSHELIFDGRISRLVLANDVTERKRVEESLRQAEANYRNLVELSPAIVYLTNAFPPYEPIYVSPNIAKFGYQPEDWLNKSDFWLSLIHEEDRNRIHRMTEDAMSQNLDTNLEYRIKTKEGQSRWVHDKGCFVADEQGEKIGWQGVIVDVTETKLLEEQLLQSQKLESVGRLAGGIAHDFNNMLTAINGYSDLTLRRMREEDPLRRNIEEIKKAGSRSAELTYQLLAFSRQQVLKPKIVKINEIVDETSKMLQRLIGEDIHLVTNLRPKTGHVKVDPAQLSQILMNLAVNARDAMPKGGKLTIETDNVFLDPAYVLHHADVLPGAYVLLAVSDNGMGMSAETKKHIFEPFFTTKPIGRGTGLGLATVYGIVKQSGGNINLYSEEGIGTTFKIYLPRIATGHTGDSVEIERNDKALSTGTGTILLVEDEDLVRALAKQVLEECGYTVIEAGNGVEALAICNEGNYKFDLVMTDVVMPQMGGDELAGKLKEKFSDLQILFTSGYADDAVVRHGVIEDGTNFIQKPFNPDSLAEKVREIMSRTSKR